MSKNVRKLAVTGMFAAMIFVLTMFVKFPVASGYVHFGDALIYVSSLIIGPWAILAGAIGEGLADVAGGYALYAPVTVIIKSLVAIPFLLLKKERSEKLLSPFSASVTIISGAITVGGYFLADLIIDKAYAVVDVPGNLIQAFGSALIFIVIAAALDKAKIRNKINF